MPISADDVIDLLSVIVDEENLKVAVKESLTGGLIAGCSTVVGGLLAGPAGMAFGGAAGGATAAYMSWGKFEPVSKALGRLNTEQKQELYEVSLRILKGITVTDAMNLNSIVLGDAILRQQMLDGVIDHVKNKMKMEIID